MYSVKNKRSRRIEAIVLSMILVITTFTGAWVWAADDELQITTTELPRGRAGEMYPSVQLQATGGSGEGYVFSLEEGSLLFKGLTLSPDGTISGIPQEGGTCNVTFIVTDSAGNTATKRLAHRVASQTVNFTVTDNRHIYNGQPHTANVKPNTAGISESDYTVLYGGEPSRTESGQYLITVRMNKAGYVAGNISTLLIITRNTSSAVNLTSQTVDYDGQPHAIVPTVTLDGETLTLDQLEGTAESVRVTYIGINGTSYPLSENAPVNSGTYRVTAALSSPGYTERTATATLTIEAPRIDFTVSGDMNCDYDGKSHALDVQPVLPDGSEPVNFNVKYDDLSTADITEDDADVIDAGEYEMYITFDDVNHAVGSITHTSGTANATRITVNPRMVDFSVENTIINYDSAEHEATITPLLPAGIPVPENIDVTYTNAEEENPEVLKTVSKPGIYNINIAIDDSNYEVGEYDPKTLTINASKVNFNIDTESLHAVYNGKPHGASVSAVSTEELTITEDDYIVTYDNVDTPDPEKLTKDEVINAGRYKVNVELKDKNIFAEVPEAWLVIDKKPVDFEVSEATVTYTGQIQQAKVEVSAGSAPEEGVTETEYKASVTYVSTEAEAGTEGAEAVSEIGTYNINVSVSGENHTFGRLIGDSVFTINPRLVDFEITSASAVYDGSGHKASVKVAESYTGEALTEGTDYNVTYTRKDTEGAEAQTEATDAGTYEINIEFTDKTYAAGNVDGAEFVVYKRPVSFAVTNETVPYSGDLQKATVTPITDSDGLPAAGEFIEDTDYRVTYTSTDTESGGAAGSEAAAGTPAVSEIGTYRINVDVVNENYEFGAIEGDKDIFTISHKALIFTVSDTQKVYSGEAQTASVGLKDAEGNELPPGITWAAVYSTKNAAGETGETVKASAVTDAGIYSISIELAGEDADKYAAVFEAGGETSGSAEFTIVPKTVLFEVSDNVHPYDGAQHRATVTMLPDQGEGIPEPIVTYDHTENEELKGLADAREIGKYNIVITFDNANYTAAAASGSKLVLEISRKSVLFEIANTEKEYSGSAQQADVTPKPEEGQTEADIPSYRVSYTVNMEGGGTEKAEAVTDAGIYTIGVEFTGENAGEFSAEFVYADGSVAEPIFTITPKKIKMVLSETEHTYDGTSHSAIVSYAEGQDVSELPETPTVTYDDLATPDTETLTEVTAIGEYAVNVDLGSGNYIAVSEDGSRLIYAIKHKSVVFTVSNAEVTYNAEAQQANVERRTDVDAGGDTGEETVVIPDYKIMYDNQNTEERETDEAVTDAGIYAIYVEFTGEGADEYAAVFEGDAAESGAAVFTVSPKAIMYNVTDAEPRAYSAEPQRVTVTLAEGQDTEGAVLPSEEPTVTYDNKDTEEDDALEAALDAGTYEVKLYLGSDNFKAVPAEGSSFELVITPKEVAMTVSEKVIDMGLDLPPYRAKLAPADTSDAAAQKFTDYTVTYTEVGEGGASGAVHTGYVTAAGTYKIGIKSNDKNYTAVLADENAELTVTYEGQESGAPVPVHFEITESRAEYSADKASYEAAVTSLLEGFTDYTVKYYAAEDTAKENPLEEVTVPGRYSIEITVTDENHKLGLINVKNGEEEQQTESPEFILTNPVTITIENGNSIGARLTAEDESGKALERFQSTRMYEDVYYGTEAWEEGSDLDADVKAYFITPYLFELGALEEVREVIAGMISALQYEAVYAYAGEGGSSAPDISIMINGSTIDEWTGALGYRDSGIYDMQYSYYDDIEGKNIVLETRKIVVLVCGAGDANGDRNLNVSDVNYLRRKVVNNEELLKNPNTNERLKLYRIYDANHDGSVNVEDVNTVLARMSEPVINFYDFY